MEKRNNEFTFCFKKAGRLRLVEPNNNLVEVYKRKSKSALNMLDSAEEKQEDEWILDTSYYAKYFIVYALFRKIGIKSEIHDCTIFALKSLFVNEGVVNNKIYEELKKSKDFRIGALYYDKEFGGEEILKRAKIAPEFCLKVEETIEKISNEQIKIIRSKFNNLKKLTLVNSQ